jgi:hypothetical protein
MPRGDDVAHDRNLIDLAGLSAPDLRDAGKYRNGREPENVYSPPNENYAPIGQKFHGADEQDGDLA